MTNTATPPTKYGTPTQPKRIPWNLSNHASELEAEPLAEYIERLRTDTPRSIAEAMAIHGRAKHDVAELRACREALALIEKAEGDRPAAERKVAKLDDKLGDVRAEIARLQELEGELEQQVQRSQGDLPRADQFKRRAAMIANNTVIRQALASELQAVGI